MRIKILDRPIGGILMVVIIFLSEYIIGTLFIVFFGFISYETNIEIYADNNLDVFLVKSILLSILLIIVSKNPKILSIKWITFQRSALYCSLIVFICILKFLIFYENRDVGHESIVPLYLVNAIIIVPIYEELFYRGIGVGLLTKSGVNNFTSVFITSIFFSIVHLPVISQSISAFFLGLLCSYVYLKEKNILYPILIHIVYNLFETIVYSLF
jgi:membrane protease YdiL (CAAX protease family)